MDRPAERQAASSPLFPCDIHGPLRTQVGGISQPADILRRPFQGFERSAQRTCVRPPPSRRGDRHDRSAAHQQQEAGPASAHPLHRAGRGARQEEEAVEAEGRRVPASTQSAFTALQREDARAPQGARHRLSRRSAFHEMEHKLP